MHCCLVDLLASTIAHVLDLVRNPLYLLYRVSMLIIGRGFVLCRSLEARRSRSYYIYLLSLFWGLVILEDDVVYILEHLVWLD